MAYKEMTTEEIALGFYKDKNHRKRYTKSHDDVFKDAFNEGIEKAKQQAQGLSRTLLEMEFDSISSFLGDAGAFNLQNSIRKLRAEFRFVEKKWRLKKI